MLFRSEYLNFVDVKKGDSIFIPSGTIHALLGKTLVAEVQQNSNVTYRVYDWGRVGKDGKPRQLHIREALDVICVTQTPQIQKIDNQATKVSVVQSEFFTTNKINVKDQFSESLSGESFLAMNVVEGRGKLKVEQEIYEIEKGNSFILPACVEQYQLEGTIEILASSL